MTSRAFRDGDLQLLLELEQELWPDVQQPYGQLAWWSSDIPHHDWEARLWFDGDRLAGWGWLTDEVDLGFQVRPTHASLLDDILDWARPNEVPIRSDDEDALARARAHALEHDPAAPWMRLNSRTLESVDKPRIPEGYRLRTVEERDFDSRVEAHRSAFNPSRFTDDVYAFVRSSPGYRPDLDCIVESPDGTIAAYALAWLDERNRVGELEPVGAHADHRRRGLGRAVSLFALQRLRDEGATTALVGCRGDDAYPIPRQLYESIGFRERWRQLTFRRATPRPS